MPAFNEASGIGDVLKNLRETSSDMLKEILVIDDGSNDDTSLVAKQNGARVIRHSRNLGYGASLKTGIHHASSEYVLMMDSDGQHRALDVRRLWEKSKDYDLVVGYRTRLIHSSLWRMPGKWILGVLANYLTREQIPDLNSGLRLFRRDVILKYLHLCPSGFSFSTTTTVIFLHRGYNVAYVPIEVNKRIGKSSVSIRTGFNAMMLILRLSTLFDPLRIFLPISLLFGLGGILWGIPYAVMGRGVSMGSMLLIVTAVLLFGLGLLCDQISQLRLERFE
jgi:glycosyltransferase involved in cell wall biosynthesis